MKRTFTFLFALILTSTSLMGQITGTRNIPSANYPDLSVAADSLNQFGTVTGGVTFVLAGDAVYNHTETIQFTVTGTADAPIVFEWDGVGERPVLNFPGTIANLESGLEFSGSDYITLSGLDIQNPDGLLETGILFKNASGTNGCHYNTVQNTRITLDKNNPYQTQGVMVNAAIAPTNIDGAMNNNQFIDNVVSNTAFGYYFEGNTSDVTLMSYGNIVGSTEEGESLVDDIVFCGVYFRSQNGGTIHGTTISNMERIGDGTTAPAAISTTSGLPSDFLSNPFNIYDNRIVNAHSGFTSIFGMYINARKSIHNIYNNVLHNITATGGTNKTATGIMLFGTDIDAYIYNNMVSGVAAPSSELSTAPVSKGIEVRSFASAYIYHNTVMLEYDALSTLHHSAAFYLNNSSDMVDLRNNIFVNLANPTLGGTGQIAAFFKSTNNFTNLDANSDNNLYYAGGGGSSNLLFYGYNSTSPVLAQTLEEYQSAAATIDQNSFTENVAFMGEGDLHIDPMVNTVVRENAQPITEPIVVDFDIDGFERDTETPDIGAQELPEITLLLPQNPYPENMAQEVGVNLVHFGWEYINQPNTLEPAGFHLMVATDVAFENPVELFEPWIPYVTGQQAYFYSLPETPILDFETVYYWKVIPSTSVEEVPEEPVVDIWTFTTEMETFDYPLAAFNPLPADEATDVEAELTSLAWEHEHDVAFALPVGFHVYMGQTEALGEEDLIGWVEFIEEKSSYTFAFSDGSELLPYESDWYWKIVPTADQENGPEAPDALVWSFSVESDPYVGIDDQQHASPVFYPNPVQDRLNIRATEASTLKVFDITGKKLTEINLEPGVNTLDMNGFPRGILLVQLINGKEVTTQKISRR
ncbi:MAG: T9SS type A sorting domain-containing protein [Bacteroides sp.]|jgi:hypothetical protein|nr:T9SS type A sorting domain-containing protein [Bacteroides sp.]